MKKLTFLVGGLGENVREDDLGKIFTASLGSVETIFFITTKGRRFAIVEFIPSSPKSIPKIFSTYNGCVWKGGRLRLEKAKEHYLGRLKREWEEDAKRVCCARSSGVDADKSILSADSSKKLLNSGKAQLRIFFPKLKKVKSLPFSGTGKHKYSFQRVKVPPLPIHFCDCEEHSVPHTAKENNFHDSEAQSGGIHEEELNMMKSVMNKLFESENISKSASSIAGFVEEGDDPIKSNNDTLLDDDEATDESDEDNFIINMVTRVDKSMTLSGSHDEGSKFHEVKISKGEAAQDMLKVQEKEIISSKKRKLLTSEKCDTNGSVSGIYRKKGSLPVRLHDAVVLLEPRPPVPELSSRQSTTNLSWSQKSSWKELVGNKGNGGFSISRVLPGGVEEQQRSSGLDSADSSDSQNQDLLDHGDLIGQSGQSKEHERLAEAQLSNAVNESARGAFSISHVLPGGVGVEEKHRSSRLNSADSFDSKNQDLINHEDMIRQSDWSKKHENVAEAQPSNAVNKSGRGASWLQKSSWTQLVGEINNSSFSISQILPGTDLHKSNGLDVANLTESKHCNLASLGLGEGIHTASHSSNIVDKNSNGLNVEQGTVEKNISNSEVSASAQRTIGHSAPKGTSIGDMEIDGTCSFMRCAASLKEWVNTKATLTRSAKRKNNKN